jgi:quercetin dioxygenase-like cupin family protein
MQHSKPELNFEDDRGTITDILTRIPIDAVTVIRSNRGVVRGNHYHKDTIQWIYVQSGKLKSLTQMGDDPLITRILNPGDLLLTETMEKHTMVALEDSEFFVFTRGPRSGDGYENDTYKLDVPLETLSTES